MTTTPTLRAGAKGTAVLAAQTRLRMHGAKIETDSIFGPATTKAVKTFQKAKKLDPDGVIGAKTWKALYGDPHEASTKRILEAMGWRVNTTARYVQAIRDFQAAWNLGPALTVDGDPGPKTRAALALSDKRRKGGKGDVSEHFSAREMACRCGGVHKDCRRIWVTRDLLQAAENLRTIIGPYTPYRACRCPKENTRVGGAKNSQHLHGCAMDLGTERGVYGVTVAQIRALKCVSGIGWYSVGGRQIVRHVDVRPASSPAAPATWSYGAFGTRSILTPRPTAA